MIVKVINENEKFNNDLSRIKIKINKVWPHPCIVDSMIIGESNMSLSGVLRTVLNNAIEADKIVLIPKSDVQTGDLTSFNRLVRIEKDICMYLGKEIYRESDLDKLIEEKEKKDDQNDTEAAHDGCMHQSICTSCFLQQVSKDPNARIRFGEGGMCFVEHAQNEEKIRCIAEKCALFGTCFIFNSNGKSCAKFEISNGSGHLFCKRDGGPVLSNFGGTCSGDGVRLDGTCCCHGSSGSWESVPGRNEASCGRNTKPHGQS